MDEFDEPVDVLGRHLRTWDQCTERGMVGRTESRVMRRCISDVPFHCLDHSNRRIDSGSRRKALRIPRCPCRRQPHVKLAVGIQALVSHLDTAGSDVSKTNKPLGAAIRGSLTSFESSSFFAEISTAHHK